MEWLAAYRPDLVERYEELYARGAYLPPTERGRLAALLRRRALDVSRTLRRDPAPARRRDAHPPQRTPARSVRQDTLF
jgi:hypothetical protein